MPKKPDVLKAIQDLKGEEFTRDEIADRMGAGTTGEKAWVFSLITRLIRDDILEVLEKDRYRQPVRLREKSGPIEYPIKIPSETKSPDPVIMCTRCGKHPAMINSKTGRPVNGLCGFCRERKAKENKRKKIELGKTETSKITEEMLQKSPYPVNLTEEVDTITFPIPGGILKEFMDGLKKSADKAFRPWWYQATFYICEGLRKDGYL